MKQMPLTTRICAAFVVLSMVYVLHNTGIDVGSAIDYHTLEGYCIVTKGRRICENDLSWKGETPAIIKGKLKY